ncbi:hypothetical protein [Lactococcus formosensis]|jgi:hypothetical protein|uniref:hypothetical protein n=1 Tax=Lactococcus formosensis TaxID=1281486 RepID=UPI00288CEDEA|nr:hypothetical protein [Lactococcus formosensis]MDT2726485.1 hypothetical protein [Lactococcus formosensis]
MWTDIKITDIITAIVSIAAVVLSYFAIRQTKKQIELSNKHQLFEKRSQCYLEGKKLLGMYDNGKELLDRILKNDSSTPEPFSLMYSKVMVLIDDYFLSKKYFPDNMEIDTEEIYRYISNIKLKAEQLELVFDKEEVEYLHDFMMDYVTLLNRIIPYYRTLKLLDGPRQEIMKETKSYEKFAEEMVLHQDLLNEREELVKLKEQIISIKESYSKIDKDYLSTLEKRMIL